MPERGLFATRLAGRLTAMPDAIFGCREDELRRHGFVVEDVREAPDRPGPEFVFVARWVER